MARGRGKRLKEIRIKLGFNQSQAAALSGVLQKEISLLENDKRENVPTEYINWLGSLGVNLNWIFVDSGSMFVNYSLKSIRQAAAENEASFVKLTDLANRVNLIQKEIKELKLKTQTSSNKNS
jgi:transcriptional regulator with XRE-family HTH domain